MKSLGIWVVEMLLQVPLATAYLLLRVKFASPDEVSLVQLSAFEVQALLAGVLVFVVGSGYCVTTAIAALVLRHCGRWIGPSIAATLLLVHYQLFLVGNALTRPDRLLDLLAGAVLSFSTTFLGGVLWRAWTRQAP